MKVFLSVLAAAMITLLAFFYVQRHETTRYEHRQELAELDRDIRLAEAELTQATTALRAELASPMMPGAGPDTLTSQINRLNYLSKQTKTAEAHLNQLKAKRAEISK